MPPSTRYFFIASMDVDADKEGIFNEVYDTEHVPSLMKVPGVKAVTRSKVIPAEIAMGGERKALFPAGEPRYHAIYEIENPAVLVSDAWAAAVEEGRWPSEVRPFTRNRRHVLHEVVE